MQISSHVKRTAAAVLGLFAVAATDMSARAAMEVWPKEKPIKNVTFVGPTVEDRVCSFAQVFKGNLIAVAKVAYKDQYVFLPVDAMVGEKHINGRLGFPMDRGDTAFYLKDAVVLVQKNRTSELLPKTLPEMDALGKRDMDLVAGDKERLPTFSKNLMNRCLSLGSALHND